MRRVNAIPGLCGAALVLAAGCWWWSSALLAEHRGFSDLPQTSAAAAGFLVTGQWLAALLLAARWLPVGTDARRCSRDGATAALMIIAPGWPLLVLLWLTSDLSAATLAASQALVATSSAALAPLMRALAQRTEREETAELLRGTVAVTAAVLVGASRQALYAWVAA